MNISEPDPMRAQSVETEPTPRIEFWFEFASNYSYLSAMRIEEAAQAQGVQIIWKPFLLGPIFRDFGWETSPFLLQKEKGAHMWQDMVRQCRKYGVRWTRPSKFPRLGVLPARVALLNAEQPWIGAFCQHVMELNFVHDEDINRADRLAPILAGLRVSAGDILREAETDVAKTRLREQTAEARARGIFGAPTFFVGNEMFWGNDRLDDALAFAANPSS
jgi:2-hydroxychromene-2-carboxylate isomerase